MKRKLTAASFLVLILFQACKTEEPLLYNPSIKSISFAGFAAEDVRLDQVKREITLVMPATMNTSVLKPTLQLTDNAEVTAGLTRDGFLDLTNYCPCMFGYFPGSPLPAITLTSKIDGQSLPYYVRMKTKAPLVIKPSTTPLIYSISDKSVRGVVVPVENYYGSEAIRLVTITNIDTQKSAYTSADGACMNDCSPVGLNRMSIFLNYFFRDMPYGFGPGSYRVEFRLNDGTIVKTPQPIHGEP